MKYKLDPKSAVDHSKQYRVCYQHSETIVKCQYQNNRFCPRICRLFSNEQGESAGLEKAITKHGIVGSGK